MAALKRMKGSENSLGPSREAVLASCFVILIAMFGVTAAVTRSYHKRIHTLADEWYADGQAALAAESSQDAVTDFRNALVYSPNNSVFQFQLSQALVAAHRWNDAEDYLQNLLSETPGSGEINLSLARIAAHQNSMADAMRYYHGAIYGAWQKNPIDMRWRARFELCRYLLAQKNASDAEAEVIALADDTAAGDLEGLNAAGNLLLKTQLWPRALEEFKMSLASDRQNSDALAGAATATFQLAQLKEASGYLERLPKEKRAEPEIASMVEMIQQADAADPTLRDLTTKERATRALAALSAAESRAEQCGQSSSKPMTATPAATDLQASYQAAQAEATRRRWTERGLTANAEQVEDVMSVALQLEDLAAKQCGEPASGLDRTLRLLAHERGNASR